MEPHTIDVIAYSPILLFGFWRIAMRFKAKPNWFTRYLGKGYKTLQQFQRNFGQAD